MAGLASGPSGMVAVIAIAGGVILMSLRGGADLSRMSGHALFFALGTACFTAGYTIVDGMGDKHEAAGLIKSLHASGGTPLRGPFV